MLMKKPPYIIASIRIDEKDWITFGRLVDNKSDAIRKYIRSLVNECKTTAKSHTGNKPVKSK